MAMDSYITALLQPLEGFYLTTGSGVPKQLWMCEVPETTNVTDLGGN